MNRRSLMISTMLMSAMGVSGVVGNVWAADVQCLKTPSCEELGYTEVACFQNNGVKCPYGDKYFCVCPMNYKFTCTGENQTGGSGEACNGKYTECTCASGYEWNGGACTSCDRSYQYTCTGTGYSGGSGTACGGKYTSCTCAEGYKWEKGQCKERAVWGQCTGYAENCMVGDILFSDGMCHYNTVSGKTPIAVVVYISRNGCGQAMALKSLGTYSWGAYGTSIPGLGSDLSSGTVSQDFASCENSAKIRAAGDSNKYPAVWAAYNYSTEGTKTGDWCLPAAGILASIYDDIVSYDQSNIEAGFNRAGGEFTNDYIWSSSVYGMSNTWHFSFNNSYGLDYSFNTNYFNVCPVIEF